jgi:hypothetical protein
MFARRVSMQLKPNSVAEFTQRTEKDILPLLRKQVGFKDENHIYRPGGNESVRNQFVGQQRARRSLQPRNVSRSDEDPGESR